MFSLVLKKDKLVSCRAPASCINRADKSSNTIALVTIIRMLL